jgi:Ni/Fe-hydrogenase subunit HybB-like protein
MNVAVVGITSTYGATYYPHWMEVAITAGIVAAGVLAYVVICSNFPVFASAHAREAHSSGNDQVPMTKSQWRMASP